jgi:hypothetical protein
MAYSRDSGTLWKNDKYGSHATAWCKKEKTKTGKAMLVGYVGIPNSDKVIKVTRIEGTSGKNRKGEDTFPIEVTIFKSESHDFVGL